jgi:hypothetical protein
LASIKLRITVLMSFVDRRRLPCNEEDNAVGRIEVRSVVRR